MYRASREFGRGDEKQRHQMLRPDGETNAVVVNGAALLKYREEAT
jgi:hypothetical protein